MQEGIIRKLIFLLIGFVIMSEAYASDITISIVYNNIAHSKDIISAWGMACTIVGLEKTILFDTGGDGNILLSNMNKMNIDPKRVDVVVLSHNHSDHTGGLWKFLDENPKVIVYLPSSFPEKTKKSIKQRGARFVEVDKSIEIFPAVYSSGELGTGIKEQSLILKTSQGAVIITGCSHPGIVTIVKEAVKISNDKVCLITGGFHLGGASELEIQSIINDLKDLGVKKIGPSHCTGERAIKSFKDAWGNNFIEAGCGAKVELAL